MPKANRAKENKPI